MENNNIPGWFPEENQKTLEKLIRDHNIETVIEIGSFVGKSTVFFAKLVKHVIAIEPFDAIKNCNYLNPEMLKIAQDQRAEFDKNTAGFENIRVMPMTSKGAALSSPITADLIFIDGSHDYEDVLEDIKIWLPRTGKVICGDDYSPWWPGVRKAVDELLPEANKDQRVWYFIKK